jgi:hypothetical protein
MNTLEPKIQDKDALIEKIKEREELLEIIAKRLDRFINSSYLNEK